MTKTRQDMLCAYFTFIFACFIDSTVLFKTSTPHVFTFIFIPFLLCLFLTLLDLFGSLCFFQLIEKDPAIYISAMTANHIILNFGSNLIVDEVISLVRKL